MSGAAPREDAGTATGPAVQVTPGRDSDDSRSWDVVWCRYGAWIGSMEWLR